MSLKLYIAGPYHLRDILRRVADLFRQAGVEVVSSWLEETAPVTPDYSLLSDDQRQVMGEIAQRDAAELEQADMLLIFPDSPAGHAISDGRRVPLYTAGGARHTELGIALYRKIPIFLVGEAEQIFHFHPQIVSSSLRAAFTAILQVGNLLAELPEEIEVGA